MHGNGTGFAALVLSGLAYSAGACAATITVDETADELNSDGDCSLREALVSANTNPATTSNPAVDACASGDGVDTIELSDGIYEITVTGTENDDASANDLDIRDEVTIESAGSDPNDVIIRPGSGYTGRALHYPNIGTATDTITLHGLTISDFDDTAFTSNSNLSVLHIESSIVRGNRTQGQYREGGAIDHTGGTTHVSNSTFVGNSTGDSDGGAIATEQLIADNSTFVDNAANRAGFNSRNGGAILITYSGSGVISRLDNVTIVGNSAAGDGGGIYVNDGGELTARNSILAHNRAEGDGPECAFETSGLSGSGHGYNLIYDDTDCGLSTLFPGTHIVGESPMLGTLGTYDANTPVKPPLDGSPVVDAGDCYNSASPGVHPGPDQRGVARPGSGCDIGAVERDWTPLSVDSGSDTPDANSGDGTCADGSGNCTLRAAVDEANAGTGLDEIILPAGDFVLSRAGANENANGTGDLDVANPMILRGAGADDTTIDAAGIDRALHALNATLGVRDLAITGGNTTGSGGTSDGGGIAASPELNVTRTELVDNRADGASTGGGGILIQGDLRLYESTLSGNVAVGGYGGGIALQDVNGRSRATIRNTTITDNEAYSAGGLFQINYPNTAIEHSTIADNHLSGSGAHQLEIRSFLRPSRIVAHDTVVATSVAGSSCSTNNADATIVSAGHNLESGASCGFGESSDHQSTAPGLTDLASSGGPVRLAVPQPGSAVVDAGACVDASGLIPASLPMGGTRPQDAHASGDSNSTGDGNYDCDIGAAERQQVRLEMGANAPSNRLVPAGSTGVVMAQIAVTNEGGEEILGDSPVVTLSATGSGDDAADVAGVRLVLDADEDGEVDPGETQAGTTQTFGSDDGEITFDFGPAANPPNLPSSETANYLVVYDFASQLAARPVAIDGRTTLAGVAGGLGTLALLAGALGCVAGGRRRAIWLVPITAAVLTLAACGGGGGGGGGSGPQSETFTTVLSDVSVTTTGGTTLDLRTPPVQGATVTVEE